MFILDLVLNASTEETPKNNIVPQITRVTSSTLSSSERQKVIFYIFKDSINNNYNLKLKFMFYFLMIKTLIS